MKIRKIYNTGGGSVPKVSDTTVIALLSSKCLRCQRCERFSNGSSCFFIHLCCFKTSQTAVMSLFQTIKSLPPYSQFLVNSTFLVEIAISTGSPGSHWNTCRTGVNMSQLHLQEAKRLTIPKISQADRLSSMGSHWPTQAPRNPPEKLGELSNRMWRQPTIRVWNIWPNVTKKQPFCGDHAEDGWCLNDL